VGIAPVSFDREQIAKILIMTTLIATTIWRYASVIQCSGHIYVIDLERRQVTACCRMIDPDRTDDPNPRGGMRGARGIAADEHSVWIANYNAIYQFDPAWRTAQVISHPACGNIHDIRLQQDQVWITSTANDRLVAFSRAGQLISNVCLTEFAELRRLAGLSGDALRSGRIDFREQRLARDQRYDRLHVNSLCFVPNGDAIVCLGMFNQRLARFVYDLKWQLQTHGLWRHIVAINQGLMRGLRLKPRPNSQLIVNAHGGRSAIVRWNRRQNSVVTLAAVHGAHAPIHSLLHDDNDGTVLFDQTNTGEVIRFHPDTGETLAKLPVSDKFLRGLTWVQTDVVAVGAGQDVLLANVQNREVVGRIKLTDNPDEYVFAVATLPEGFAQLPDTLAASH
jgi:hypothetical protein